MNPLYSLPECADPGDPESLDHRQPPPVYYSRPLDLDVANDLRDTPRANGSRGRAVAIRTWSQIVGLTWHQTATRDFPASHPALDTVPAHALVHRDGSVSLLHHPTAYVQHGNALNGGTIGIEIACRAAGDEGDPTTFWRSAHERLGWTDRDHKPPRRRPPRSYAELVAEATDAQLATIPILADYYVALVTRECAQEYWRRDAGMPLSAGIRAMWAHRQGTDDRGSDPGSRIWGAVERARVALGLADVSDKTLGKGQPLPRSWLL